MLEQVAVVVHEENAVAFIKVRVSHLTTSTLFVTSLMLAFEPYAA